MSSDFDNGSLFTAVFEGKCPDYSLIKYLLRLKRMRGNTAVDLFRSDGKTLMIAYPAPPKAAVGISHLPSGRRHRF